MTTFIYAFAGTATAIIAVGAFLCWVYSGPAQNEHHGMNRS